MKLKMIEEAMQLVHDKIDHLNFPDLMFLCREAIGMKQYKASEFLKISLARVKNLETGNFRDMPPPYQVKAFALLYGIEYKVLVHKAKKYVESRVLSRKVKVFENDESL